MPLYEYECNQCRERVEIIQNFSDPPYAHCPKCGGTMKKLASAPAIQFKGSGFYKTDYPSKTSGSSESKSETKPDSKSETKSDSRSETKSDSRSETKSDSRSEKKSE
jgi:putative FmdB family regulatory protein